MAAVDLSYPLLRRQLEMEVALISLLLLALGPGLGLCA